MGMRKPKNAITGHWSFLDMFALSGFEVFMVYKPTFRGNVSPPYSG
jgi:hypothetical protein